MERSRTQCAKCNAGLQSPFFFSGHFLPWPVDVASPPQQLRMVSLKFILRGTLGMGHALFLLEFAFTTIRKSSAKATIPTTSGSASSY
uniref:Uncharacterized protein n=1 Tax=Timema poppense TaxID=170557 RepID=A0A7R9DTW2_TIMPO|nr:unnamed protein product [Timema poppensis]